MKKIKWLIWRLWVLILSYVYVNIFSSYRVAKYLYYNFTAYYMDESLVGGNYRAALYRSACDKIELLKRSTMVKHGILCYDETHSEGQFAKYADL